MSHGKVRAALANAWRAEAKAASARRLADSVREVLEAAGVASADILAAVEADEAQKTAAAKRATLAVVARWPDAVVWLPEVAT